MGKMVIIFVLLIVVFLIIAVSGAISRTREIPEMETEQVVMTQVRRISNYALTYAFQQLLDKVYYLNAGIQPFYFNNFNILDGSIEKIILVTNPAKDTVAVIADVCCTMQGFTNIHRGRALFAFDSKQLDPNGIDDAITTTGTVNQKGASDIKGTIAEYTYLDFASVFGYTKEEVKAGADQSYIDPENNFDAPGGITWVEQVDDNTSAITAEDWLGSGLLYVDGNLDMSGGHFYGIVWVAGDFDMGVGGAWVEGAIVIEADSTVEFKIGGTAKAEYNSEAIKQFLQLNVPEIDKYKILAWYE